VHTTFTQEQEAVLSSTGDIKVSAVAGSGKTTVLVEYAKRQNRTSRILYLAFNRSVRLQAQKRFAEQNLANVDVQTAHSLAYKRIALPLGFQIAKGYKLHDIVKILSLETGSRDHHAAYVCASHIKKFCSLFCNADSDKVQSLDYCATISDEKARAFAKHHYAKIENGTRQFLAKMDRKEIAATHDFYLKKYQLSKPRLSYDVVLFDEGQDASPVMLDVFLSHTGRRVIAGDIYQQIYSWRHAINALALVEFPKYSLTTSFRFNDHVAGLAMECLSWKSLLGETDPRSIRGVGANKKIKTQATIARTNLALLKSAILTMQHARSIKKIYFEGNINSYTYASDGASIYDVLNLSLDKRSLIRDPVIASMPSFDALEEYAENSDDIELLMLIDIVGEYGKEIPYLLKKLTAMHVDDDKRYTADMIFSTVHRCKGMEYDSITLADDFITRERVRKLVEKGRHEPVDISRISEEINLAYVAVTRSRNFLEFPECMFPDADATLFAKRKIRDIVGLPKRRTGTPPASRRPAAGNAYKSWTKEEDKELLDLFGRGRSLLALAERFGRKQSAIRSRLSKLSWVD